MWQQEIDIASRLAREAGDIILKVYETAFAVSFKGPNDPVTEADKGANDLIVDGLRKAFPQDGVVAEETPDRSDALHQGRVWYVDPLDGTRDFIARNGEFCVMIGLAVDGQAQIGVVYSPVEQVLYGGVTDQTAWKEAGGVRTTLNVSSYSDPQELRLVVSRSHRHPVVDQLKSRVGIRQELRRGSVGLKIGMLAERLADVYIETSTQSSAWDACGPEAILRGAGGRFTDIAGNTIVYGGPELRNRRGLVGSNGRCHDFVLAALQPLARDANLL
jgi:3'(2'), 5'-bisphosphate nucleotidase